MDVGEVPGGELAVVADVAGLPRGLAEGAGLHAELARPALAAGVGRLDLQPEGGVLERRYTPLQQNEAGWLQQVRVLS